MGGSHPSALPEEALEHADQVVVGEAEYVVKDVFEGHRNERLVYGEHVRMDDVPPVDLGLIEGFRKRTGEYIIRMAPIMASRGCPYNCVFCSVTGMFGRAVRVRDADLVMEEVRMRYAEGFRDAFFYDDNFAANPGKAKIFLEKLARANLDFRWSSQFSVHVAEDPELVNLLVRAKCHTLLMGMESINPEALRDYGKSQTAEAIGKAIDTLTDAGLEVHSMFILGADSDTEATIDRTVEFACRSKSVSTQYSILFPIPGTKLYDTVRKERRIFVNDWDYYDGTHVVIQPKQISPLLLQRKFFDAYRRYYTTSFKRRLLSRIGLALWWWNNRGYASLLKKHMRSFEPSGAENPRSDTVAG